MTVSGHRARLAATVCLSLAASIACHVLAGTGESYLEKSFASLFFIFGVVLDLCLKDRGERNVMSKPPFPPP